MDFQRVVERRSMRRAFQETPVPDAKLQRILQNALHAPSAGFSQGWAFVVVRKAELKRKLAEAAGEEYYVRGGHKYFISKAPVVIVPCGSEKRYVERYREPDKLGPDAKVEFEEPWWLIDPAFASLLMMLTAVDEGLGSCFVGSFDRNLAREALGIPLEYEPLAIMPLGYPAKGKKSPSLKRGRKPVSEVVHYECW